ncbi:tyrosine-type recombinase/integrase [Haloarchaeobius sp. TZWSO28]|uniref:tyrosine-type recombinase/integrase n=1 Tax=Haloarchaeobius sp. TZWSO28 TaxID=3446119 RepID=UPI003EBFA7A8
MSEKTVGEAYDRWLSASASRKNASTLENYRSSTGRFADKNADRCIESIDEDDVDEHLDWILNQGEWSKSTQVLRYQGFKAFWRWLYKDKRWIDHNPTDRVSIYDVEEYSANYTRKADELKAKNGIVFVEADEVEQVARHVRPPRIRNELMVKLAFQTGLRPVELCRVKCQDINYEERRIKVKTAKRDKAHYRDVWYRESLDMLMERWKTDRKSRLLDDTPFFFTTNRSGSGGSTNVGTSAFRDTVVYAAEDAGIQDVIYTTKVEVERDGETQIQHHDHRRVTPHALRHGFAVSCVRDGMDIRSLQLLMGHSKIETTSKYLDLDGETLKNKVDRFGPA